MVHECTFLSIPCKANKKNFTNKSFRANTIFGGKSGCMDVEEGTRGIHGNGKIK